MVEVHTHGWKQKILDTNLRDQVQKTMFCTFADRFDALVKLLTVRCYFYLSHMQLLTDNTALQAHLRGLPQVRALLYCYR